MEETSSDAELSDWQKDTMDYAKRMVQSPNKVDQRFMSLYKIRRAEMFGIHIGFNEKAAQKQVKLRRYFTTLIKDDLIIPLTKKENKIDHRKS